MGVLSALKRSDGQSLKTDIFRCQSDLNACAILHIADSGPLPQIPQIYVAQGRRTKTSGDYGHKGDQIECGKPVK